MLFLHLILLSVLFVIIFSISSYRNAKRAEKKAKNQYKDNQVVFFRDDCDLTNFYESAEWPYTGAN